MRARVCVMLLSFSAALAGCSSFDQAGNGGGLFANGKDPVGPNVAAQASLPEESDLPAQAENVASEQLAAAPAVVEEATERPAKRPRKVVRRPKAARTSEPPKTRQVMAPAAPPPATTAPAAPSPAKPAAAAAEKPAPKPTAAQTATRASAPKPTPVSAPADPKRLNSPWPEAPTAGSFSH